MGCQAQDAPKLPEDPVTEETTLETWAMQVNESHDMIFNKSELVEALENFSESAASFIYCRYGSICRGGWHHRGRQRVCVGGIQCKPTPHGTGSSSSSGSSGSSGSSSGSSSSSGSGSSGSGSSGSWSSSSGGAHGGGCHGVKVCRGGWSGHGAHRVCHGGFTCR